MDTRSSSDLKKAIENLEAKKKTMAEHITAMQEQILELSVNHRDEDDAETGGSGVNHRGPRTWHSNDIKVEIPEYDGKLDPYEFVKWLRTVECAFDYKAMTEENKASFSQLHHLKQNQRTAEEYSREFEYLLMKCDMSEDDPQTLVRCFRCQRLGHIASECPNKKMITLAEFEEGDNYYAIDATVESVVMIDHVVEEVVGPDKGACLVVRRTLSNTPDRAELL
nr:hypothetical protein [Tanacetum cinerariifolium]